MPLRSIVLIVMAIAFAGLTAMVARNLLSGTESPPPQPAAAEKPKQNGVQILVAATSLDLGRILKEGDLHWRAWPEDGVDENYFTKDSTDIAELHGSVVRNPILAGEPVTRGNLVKPGERGFLAAALSPGMRAVTVRVNEVSGISGFIFPGDRVDLILNQQVTPQEGGETRHVSETIVENIRVLAVDTRTETPATGDESAQPRIAKTITLEATQKVAEKIALAKQMGDIALSLRSLPTESDTKPRLVSSVTWDADVSRVLPPIDPERAQTQVRLTRGSEVSTVEFSKDPGS